MMRSVMCGMVFVWAAGVALVGSAQQPVFRGRGDIVRVFVTVTDRDGRLVTTLTQDSFEIRDRGQVQPVTQFDKAPQPIRLIVMLDVSGSMEGNLPLLRAASTQLVSRLLPDDEARLGSFGREITISPSFTRDPNELSAALPNSIPSDAPTPLWRAIDKAIGEFGDAADRRRVVLVLSDGKDEDVLNFRERRVSQAEVIDRARREDVMIYAVGMRSRGRHPVMPGFGRGGLQEALLADMPDPGLAKVAQETGGGYIEIRFGEDLGAAFAGVADELHTQYLLGFAPPQRDGKLHDIKVRVTQGKLTPRARKSYVAPAG